MASADLRRRGREFNRALRTVEVALERVWFGDAPESEAIRLTRALANTLSSDVPGLGSGSSVPDDVLAWVAASQADNLALIEAFNVAPLVRTNGLPFVPTPTPPVASGPDTQQGEKTELPSNTVVVDGDTQTPDLIGTSADVSALAWLGAGEPILAFVAAATVIRCARYVVANLDASSTPAVDIAAGLAVVEAAGWVPDLIVSSRSAFLAAVSGATPAALPEVVFGPTGTAIYVASRAGIYASFSPEAWLQVVEPSLAGREVAVLREAVFQVGAGAVAKIGTQGP